MSGGPLSLLLLAAGTGAGIACQRACAARVARLDGWATAFASIRLLLDEARGSVSEVLVRSADALPDGPSPVRDRLRACAAALQGDPSLSVGAAYEQACGAHPTGESAAERAALQTAFRLLGQGTAALRAQAAATCARQLKALHAQAEETAQKHGRLYGRLGALGGAALAILFW